MSHDTRRRDSIVGYGHGEHSATPRARPATVSMPAHALPMADLICACMCSACPPLCFVRSSTDACLAVETLLLIMEDALAPGWRLASFETLVKRLAPHALEAVVRSPLHRFGARLGGNDTARAEAEARRAARR